MANLSQPRLFPENPNKYADVNRTTVIIRKNALFLVCESDISPTKYAGAVPGAPFGGQRNSPKKVTNVAPQKVTK
jgi:hypothetical protein